MQNATNVGDCFKISCRCKRPFLQDRKRVGYQKGNIDNFSVIETKKFHVDTEKQSLLDAFSDTVINYTGKGFKVRKSCQVVEPEKQKYKSTLYCKWRDLCDCSATLKIEFIPSLNEVQVLWYRLASAHGVKQSQINFLSLDDHMSFEHILLPHEISGMYFIFIYFLI